MEKTLVFLLLARSDKWRWKRFKEEESIKILKIIGLINNIEKNQNIWTWLKNVQNINNASNINREFRLKKIDEIKNHLIKEINRNELISKKHKKVFRVVNYIDH